jgi:hypothetical protein
MRGAVENEISNSVYSNVHVTWAIKTSLALHNCTATSVSLRLHCVHKDLGDGRRKRQ